MQLDRLDRKILKELQRDGRISNVELASRVNLSESACLRRVRALEQAGLIERYVALLDPKKAGIAGNVFVQIALNREEQSELAAFEEAVQDLPEVMECYLMTGDATNADPVCELSPHHHLVVEAVERAERAVNGAAPVREVPLVFRDHRRRA